MVLSRELRKRVVTSNQIRLRDFTPGGVKYEKVKILSILSFDGIIIFNDCFVVLYIDRKPRIADKQ